MKRNDKLQILYIFEQSSQNKLSNRISKILQVANHMDNLQPNWFNTEVYSIDGNFVKIQSI